MKPISATGRRRAAFVGWLLFVISATFFMVASARFGDAIGLLGGGFFLAGCLVFLAILPRDGS